MLKYQEDFAGELTEQWLAGKRSEVRIIIRQLKNKSQAAYIAAQITLRLVSAEDRMTAGDFVNFIHPNNQ